MSWLAPIALLLALSGKALAATPERHEFDGTELNERWVIDDQYCPSTAHECVQVSPGQTACVGEVLGSCGQPGFVRCEDAFTMIWCGDNGFRAVVLQRGICAAGARWSSMATAKNGRRASPTRWRNSIGEEASRPTSRRLRP